MKCHPCEQANAPNKGSPCAGHCDACGWAISPTGALTSVSPAAMMLTATADAYATREAYKFDHMGRQLVPHADIARRLTEEVKRRGGDR